MIAILKELDATMFLLLWTVTRSEHHDLELMDINTTHQPMFHKRLRNKSLSLSQKSNNSVQFQAK
jgi:hypothetical protein